MARLSGKHYRQEGESKKGQCRNAGERIMGGAKFKKNFNE